jgi:rSAM/selenodomain-associated transferase 1
MLKAPLVGKVKTRLAKEIGEVRVLAAYQKMGRFLFQHLNPHFPCEIHYAPASGLAPMREWLGGAHRYFPQPSGDLGKRMFFALDSALKRGADSAILLGGDCPYVTAEVIGEAQRALEVHDLVIGPAIDGGYYLLGAKKVHHCLFREIPWGTGRVFQLTLKRIQTAMLTVKILERLADVDDLASWTLAEEYIGRKPVASQ